LRANAHYAGFGKHSSAQSFLFQIGTILLEYFLWDPGDCPLLFYFVDFAHYAYLSQRLNASVLNYLQDAGISMNMVWQSYPVIRLLAALVLLSILILWIRKRIFTSIEKREALGWKGIRVIWFILLFLLFAFGIFGRFNQYPLRWSDAFQLGDDYKAQIALNPFESFFNTLKYRHSGFDIKKVKDHYPLLSRYFGLDSSAADKLDYRRSIQPKDSISNKPNVVLVICESFSAYKSSMYGNALNTTPFFAEMCKQGIFFDRCFTPTYGTARGVWAVITGIPDVEIQHGQQESCGGGSTYNHQRLPWIREILFHRRKRILGQYQGIAH
jgi:glucan phosphoethanolaminetransferase (alkaline phosphatase superfamily)